VIWKGWGGLLCYDPTFPLLRTSRGRALKPYAYSANGKVCEYYYAHRKEMCGREELNPRPRLWYHVRGPSSTSPTIKPRWYGKGKGVSYAMIQQSIRTQYIKKWTYRCVSLFNSPISGGSTSWSLFHLIFLWLRGNFLRWKAAVFKNNQGGRKHKQKEDV
jgi:hypothetical protein